MILNQGAYFLLAFATIGTLLSASFFIPNIDGALSESANRVKKLATILASLWAITTLLILAGKAMSAGSRTLMVNKL